MGETFDHFLTSLQGRSVFAVSTKSGALASGDLPEEVAEMICDSGSKIDWLYVLLIAASHPFEMEAFCAGFEEQGVWAND